MAKYLGIAKTLVTKYKAIKIELVGRDLNSHVDALAGLASIFEGELDGPSQWIWSQILATKSVKKLFLSTHRWDRAGWTK